ncbi:unnamed protein product [Echinostoma caproni]|uniref:ETS domain-containing protein n=1 Tax=Echinostoma caproni TaxID=27848 RepID=A0A183ABY6_9TREM|nr:unnamed protein product [Echinostoma caproni]
MSVYGPSNIYESCGNPGGTVCYSSIGFNVSPYETAEHPIVVDRPVKDHSDQAKSNTSVVTNNLTVYKNPSEQTEDESGDKFRSPRARSDNSTSNGSGRMATQITEMRKITPSAEIGPEPEPVDPVVAAASAALANFHHRGSLQLWQFLVALLDDAKSQHLICWTGRTLEFKLNEPEEVARLWGIQKNRPAMNYDKLSRSLRYYYEKGIMQKVSGERYVYRFVYEPELLFALAFPGEDQGQLNRSDSSAGADQFNASSPPTDSSGSSKDWSAQRREDEQRNCPASSETKTEVETRIPVTESAVSESKSHVSFETNATRGVLNATIHYYNPVTPSFSSSISVGYEHGGEANELQSEAEMHINPLPQNGVGKKDDDHTKVPVLSKQNPLPVEPQSSSHSEVPIFQNSNH